MAVHKALTRIAAMLFGFVLAFVVLESVLRVVSPFGSRVRGDKIILPTEVTYTFTGIQAPGVDEKIVHRKNSLGFRGEDPPPDFAERLTVFAVGGSTTECTHVSDGDDWPNLVGKALGGSFRNVWVNNAGLDGHSTFGHRILLEDYLLSYEPKVILFLVGLNDVGRDDLVPHVRSSFRDGVNVESMEGIAKSLSAYSEVVSLMLNAFRALRASRMGLPYVPIDVTTLQTLDIPDEQIDSAKTTHSSEFVGHFEERLESIVQLIEDRNIVPVLITQPALYGDAFDPSTGTNLGRVRVRDQVNGRLAWELLELYNEATRSLAGRIGVPLIDLASEMPKDSLFFFDFVHYNRRGNQAVAKIVSFHLIPILEREYPRFAKAP